MKYALALWLTVISLAIGAPLTNYDRITELTLQLVMLHDSEVPQDGTTVLIYGSSVDAYAKSVKTSFAKYQNVNLCIQPKFHLSKLMGSCSDKAVRKVEVRSSLPFAYTPSIIVIPSNITKKELDAIKDYARRFKIITVSYLDKYSDDVALTLAPKHQQKSNTFHIIVNINESILNGVIWNPVVIESAELRKNRGK